MSSVSFNFSDNNMELFNTRGYSKDEVNNFKSVFGEINQKFNDNKQEFLCQVNAAKELSKLLNSEEKEVLRKIHGLADPINFEDLNDEGLLNLFFQPGESKDIDNNGFLSIGAGLIRQFPPPNAPEHIKIAWEDTVKDMSFKEKMMAQTVFWGQELTANVKYDMSGKITGFYSPMDEKYRNIYADKNFSYNELINSKRDSLIYFKNQISAESFQFQMNILNNFQNKILSNFLTRNY